MACAFHATLAANSCAFSSRRFSLKHPKTSKRRFDLFTVRADSDDSDCNDEECAPEKEVGKVSVEWLAGEKTKVVGTFPPRRKPGWTGYVEKDTAGQTNIYSVEPAVYVAESAISSGSAGSSSDGAENTAAIVAGLALISVAAASSILLQVGKNAPPQIQPTEYTGPSLTYYINKFKPPEITEVSGHIPGGVIRTIEAVVVEVDAGVIQMGVEVEVVVAEEATKTGAIHTTTSLEIIIQGTTITTEEEEAEVVAITATMVRGVKLIMWQVTWGCIHD